jgi:DNA-binding response OmpR family regulator
MKTVLIAEDNHDLLNLFSMVFSKRGYDVYPAVDGQQALKMLERMTPDILILDHNLPFVTGLNVLKHVREALHDYHMQVILVTGNTMLEYAPEAAYADLTLIKPISPNQLVTLADRLLH